MNVIVNTLSVTPGRGGVKTYLLNLLDGLSKVASDDSITLLCSEQNQSLFDRHVRGQSNVERIVFPLRRDESGQCVIVARSPSRSRHNADAIERPVHPRGGPC
mgnify:CR=1 FL=1